MTIWTYTASNFLLMTFEFIETNITFIHFCAYADDIYNQDMDRIWQSVVKTIAGE